MSLEALHVQYDPFKAFSQSVTGTETTTTESALTSEILGQELADIDLDNMRGRDVARVS